MLTTIGSVLAGLIGGGIFLIGASYFWAPQSASGFGDVPGSGGRKAFFNKNNTARFHYLFFCRLLRVGIYLFLRFRGFHLVIVMY